MNLGLTLGLGSRSGLPTPLALFAGGVVGVWYDPSDLATLFQDTAGTVPVTAAGQSVARINDKSGNGLHATQATVASQPVYQVDGTGRGFLLFDGVDDGLATATATPTTDKLQVFAGVRKLSDAARGVVAELSVTNSTNAGTFSIEAPGSAAATSYSFRSRGSTAIVGASASSFAAPLTSVLTGIGDIANDVTTLRVNGTQAATSATDQGTGNYLAYPIYIGRRGGTSMPYNGRLYGLIVRFGANLSAAQISQTEAWMNLKTGAF